MLPNSWSARGREIPRMKRPNPAALVCHNAATYLACGPCGAVTQQTGRSGLIKCGVCATEFKFRDPEKERVYLACLRLKVSVEFVEEEFDFRSADKRRRWAEGTLIPRYTVDDFTTRVDFSYTEGK